MTLKRLSILAPIFLLMVPSLTGITLENSDYRVQIQDSGSILVTERVSGTAYRFEPEFTVLSSAKDPELQLRQADLFVAYNVPTWNMARSDDFADSFRAKERSEAQFGDGFEDSILSTDDTEERTANLFASGRQQVIRAINAYPLSGRIKFEFNQEKEFEFEASLTLPSDGPPRLSFTFLPKAEAYYSIGYTGAPQFNPETVDEIWQPLVWSEKRFPDQSYLTMSFRCPIPTALVQHSGATVGVLADSSEFPFDPLPTRDRSRFGVALRSQSGFAQPMLFAPVLGGHSSKLPVGEAFTFEVRLIVEPTTILQAFENIARRDFGFHDYRSNALGSLNDVIDRAIDYGMSEYANFNSELKGCSYSTDVPDAVKNVSSLNPLNMALIRDDPGIFEERAYPILEYMMSREKFLFALDREQKIQNPSRNMKGPAAPVSELASLYEIGHQASPVFLEYAKRLTAEERVLNLDRVVAAGRWQDYLALYQATGNAEYLIKASKRADAYVETYCSGPMLEFAQQPFFWTQFVPDFPWLLELYEETGNARYLEAAQDAARRFSLFFWMSPAIPEQAVLVNEGNEAPVYYYLTRFREDPMHIQEEWAPPWRLSAIGLTPESTSTSSGHRAIFMANYAPWLLRIAEHANDAFLHDIARSAVIGRYRNFPGYHINTDRTTIYEKADYPLREHDELNVNSFHYNHIWPFISLLFDFLVTDATNRSDGEIAFPSVFIEGYAYLQNRFYGHRPGKFYGYDDAILWMPKDLFTSSSEQLNGLSARGTGRAYFAFTNQSDDPVRSEIRLNRDLLNADPGPLPTEMWINNEKVEPATIHGGSLTVVVPPKGIVAFAVNKVNPIAEFQKSILSLSGKDAWEKDLIEADFGGLRAMILNWGPERTRAYLYLQADDTVYSQVSLILADKTVIEDGSYPYEFTVPLSADIDEFSFKIKALTVEGAEQTSETFSLKR
jgi:hypothetical protein